MIIKKEIEDLAMSTELKSRIITGVVLVMAIIIPLVYFENSYIFIVGIIYSIMFYEFLRISLFNSSTNKGLLFILGCTYIIASCMGVLFSIMGHGGTVSNFFDITNLNIFNNIISTSNGTFLTMLIIVWSSDSAGYIFGKIIGGPKLLPSVSPNKTWSGALFAAITPVILIFKFVDEKSYISVVFIILLSTSAIIGDLLESHLKRKMNIKDSSNLLPGHGGFLDRFDGLLGMGIALLTMMLI